MVKINWTDNAIFDLDEIGNYIALHSVKYAEKTVDFLFNSVSILISYPQAGKVVTDFNSNSIREIVRGNYRIVYKIISKKRIDILAVHHGARFMDEKRIQE